MVSVGTWCRYLFHKFEHSASLNWKNYRKGHITFGELKDSIWDNLLHGKLTFLHWNPSSELTSTTGGEEWTLLVRKIPHANPTRVFVGDMVVLKDPEKPESHLVRRLAAIEGQEMVSSDEKDEPFLLEEDECWVLAPNDSLKPKEANDSRTFGPVSIRDVIGRVIYSLRTAVDHGPVENSHFGMRCDSSVLQMELDVDEMAKSHRA